MDTTTALRNLLLASLLLPAAPPSQVLVKDINTAPYRTLSANPSEIVACGRMLYATVLKSEPFLAVRGKLQNEHGVVHVIAQQLWVPEVAVAPESGGSRDFH